MTDVLAIPAIDPSDRARGNVDGTPAILADGQTWILSSNFPAIGDVWDNLYDGNVIRQRYDAHDLRLAAVYLLLANYDLAPDEAAGLILRAELADLVDPVEAVLFGDDRRRSTYSEWVTRSLLANGLNPREIPPREIRGVLDYLVAIGRAIPEQQYIASARRAVRRGRFRALASQHAAQRAAREAKPPESPDA